jgi:hypothetical protein
VVQRLVCAVVEGDTVSVCAVAAGGACGTWYLWMSIIAATTILWNVPWLAVYCGKCILVGVVGTSMGSAGSAGVSRFWGALL